MLFPKTRSLKILIFIFSFLISFSFIHTNHEQHEHEDKLFLWKLLSNMKTTEVNVPGIYGEIFSDNFYPSARGFFGSFFKDDSIYIFGGKGYGSYNIDETYYLGDLWEFNLKKKLWRWINTHGDNTQSLFNFGSSYGEVFDESFYPSARAFMGSYQVQNSLYIFGGREENLIYKGDLWEFSIDQKLWKWINTLGEGLQTSDDFGSVYGETFNSMYYPGSRFGSGSFQYGDSIFLFGGQRDGVNSKRFYGDMWEFDTISNLWRFINTVGDNTQKYTDFASSYGESFSSSYYPSARGYMLSYTYQDSLFIFGGESEISQSSGKLGDIWEYSIPLEQWRVIDTVGNNVQRGDDFCGSYGESFSNANYPSARNSPTVFIVPNNQNNVDSMYMFGGTACGNYLQDHEEECQYCSLTHKDLWEFSFVERKWRFINTAGTLDQKYYRFGGRGVYGKFFDQAHYAGEKQGAAGFRYNDTLILFGGDSDYNDYGNDLWEVSIPKQYTPGPKCFGYNWWYRLACSGRGECVADDTCQCYEGVKGEDCSKGGKGYSLHLYQVDTECTLSDSHFRFSSINSDDMYYAHKVCIGGDKNNNILYATGVYDADYFSLELNKNSTVPILRYVTDYSIVSEYYLNTPIFVCTSVTGFGMKVYDGCYIQRISISLLYSSGLLLVVIISFVISFIICLIFVVLCVINYKRKKTDKKESDLEKKKKEKSNKCQCKQGYKDVFMLVLLFIVIKFKDVFILFFSLCNFVKKPSNSTSVTFLLDLDIYNSTVFVMMLIIILYVILDTIVFIIFVGKGKKFNLLMMMISYEVYKELIFSKLILLLPYTIFCGFGFQFIYSYVRFDLIEGYGSIEWFEWATILLSTVFWGVIFSMILLIQNIISTLNYNGVSCYGYYKQFLDLSESERKSFPSIKIGFGHLFRDTSGILEHFYDCISAIYIEEVKGKGLKRKEVNNYDKSIKNLENFSVYSHLDWSLVSKMNSEDITKLIDFFFYNRKLEGKYEKFLYSPILKKRFFIDIFKQKVKNEPVFDSVIDKELVIGNLKIEEQKKEKGEDDKFDPETVKKKIKELEESNGKLRKEIESFTFEVSFSNIIV